MPFQLAISWEPRWLNLDEDYGLDTAHLQIDAVEPERAMLSVTETGYRSRFTTAETVTAMGGPVAFVLAWLDHKAASPVWQRQAEAARRNPAGNTGSGCSANSAMFSL